MSTASVGTGWPFLLQDCGKSDFLVCIAKLLRLNELVSNSCFAINFIEKKKFKNRDGRRKVTGERVKYIEI